MIPNRISMSLLIGLLYFLPSLKAQNYRSGIRIGWNYRTQHFENNGGYGRVKLLKDGRQALVFDEGGICKIRFKQPRGKYFQASITVAVPPEGAGNTNAELLELSDGVLMYAWNERWATKVKVKYSYDRGFTWEDEQTLYEQSWEGDGPFGIWEPAMIELPSGEVQVYFANESGVPGNDQDITMLRSTSKTAKGSRIWQRQPVRVCYTVGARDGMPVPLVLANDRGIALAIEDDGFGGGFQPGIIYTSLEDNWASGTRYGDSSDRWIGVIGGEPRGGGAPYLIQLKSGETILSTQTNSLADTRGAPWDDMYKFRQFVYVGNAMARNFQCYSIPFPFMDEPDQGGVWNSVCQINDSTIMAVSEVHGHPSQNGIWTNEGRIMHPMNCYQVNSGDVIDWDRSMSEIFIGSQSQANMRVGSCWSRDSLYVHFIVQDRTILSPSEGAVVWESDAVEFFYDRQRNATDNVPSGVYKFLVNVDGSTLVSRSTGSGWQDLTLEQHGMRSSVEKTSDGYVVDMAIPWGKIGRRPSGNRFSGYFILHNKDLRGGKYYYYHEALSGIDTGRSATWWEYPMVTYVDIKSPTEDFNGSFEIEGALSPNNSVKIKLSESFSPNATVAIYDVSGRCLESKSDETRLYTLTIPADKGIYIIRINDEKNVHATKKILIS